MSGGESNRGGDILDIYRQISNKLKKRFLRKPNVTEACESFTSLGQHCENIEMPTYAGMCFIAAARCEGSLGNVPGETMCLIRSARNFFNSELKNKSIGCQSIANENLLAALGCYMHAQTRLVDSPSMAIGMNLEIVESLKDLQTNHYNEMYLKETIDLCQNSLDTRLHCLELLAVDYLHKGDYTMALDTFTEITNLLENVPLNGARSDVLLNSEIFRIFLLLLIKPTPQRLAPQFAKLLEVFTWGDKKDKSIKRCCMSEELFLLLQSLVITCQSLDMTNLSFLENSLWPHINVEQRNLLRSLVLVYS